MCVYRFSLSIVNPFPGKNNAWLKLIIIHFWCYLVIIIIIMYLPSNVEKINKILIFMNNIWFLGVFNIYCAICNNYVCDLKFVESWTQ